MNELKIFVFLLVFLEGNVSSLAFNVDLYEIPVGL